METSDKIYVAGHRGMVGSAIVRLLEAKGFKNILTRTRSELDLLNQTAVDDFFANERPDYVFLAAAKVGGIGANLTFKADFIYENLMIESNVIHAAHEARVKKLLFLGSSCIYPRFAPQPIREESLLTGPLEETNDAYAVAKIAGITLCRAYREQYGDDFISIMPTNLYGPNDNYDPAHSHVIAALIRKILEAKRDGIPTVEIWGTGTPRREFLHVDDLADACLFLMENYSSSDIVNIGWGEDISIKELAELIASITGYTGSFSFNTSKPDGTPRKVLDTRRIRKLGWSPSIRLRQGLTSVCRQYGGGYGA